MVVVVVVEEEEKDTNLPTRAIANAPQLVALLLGVQVDQLNDSIAILCWTLVSQGAVTQGPLPLNSENSSAPHSEV